ncbi:hypothetical protein PIROE2DRAFT_64020 [Piromyces sp. E2]|nr:hypothetical protein PIROE2DRAFT_64020 [Piromyces sp. E2]|eukprot:OUM59068.1 hypothetical protein PIROE2DRAFT_64020 [Piromyces sp. E2]
MNKGLTDLYSNSEHRHKYIDKKAFETNKQKPKRRHQDYDPYYTYVINYNRRKHSKENDDYICYSPRVFNPNKGNGKNYFTPDDYTINTNKEKETQPTENKVEETSTEKKVEKAPACNKCCGGCNCIKFLLTAAFTALLVICSFTFYLKQFQPELYSQKIEVLFNQVGVKGITKQTEGEATTQDAASTSGYNANHHKSVSDMEDILDKEINVDEYDDILNLEEKAFLKNVIKEERIYEKIKDKPEMLKIKQYMEEPIGQLVKRFSLEQQVVLFINSNDE